jgi:hypothetical protein
MADIVKMDCRALCTCELLLQSPAEQQQINTD